MLRAIFVACNEMMNCENNPSICEAVNEWMDLFVEHSPIWWMDHVEFAVILAACPSRRHGDMTINGNFESKPQTYANGNMEMQFFRLEMKRLSNLQDWMTFDLYETTTSPENFCCCNSTWNFMFHFRICRLYSCDLSGKITFVKWPKASINQTETRFILSRLHDPAVGWGCWIFFELFSFLTCRLCSLIFILLTRIK